jgi:hypothetical protein
VDTGEVLGPRGTDHLDGLPTTVPGEPRPSELVERSLLIGLARIALYEMHSDIVDFVRRLNPGN